MVSADARMSAPGTDRVTAVRQLCAASMAATLQMPRAWFRKWKSTKAKRIRPDAILSRWTMLPRSSAEEGGETCWTAAMAMLGGIPEDDTLTKFRSTATSFHECAPGTALWIDGTGAIRSMFRLSRRA